MLIKRCFVLILLCLSGIPINSNPNGVVDSLRSVIINSVNNNTLSQSLESLVKEFLPINLDSASHYINILKRKHIKEKKSFCTSFYLESLVYEKQNNSTAFEENITKAISCFASEKNILSQAEALSKLGMWLARNSRLIEAKATVEKSKTLYYSIGEEKKAISCVMTLGTLNMMLDKTTEGLEKYFTAYHYYEKKNEYEQMVKLCGNIGNAYTTYGEEQENPDNEYMDKGLEYYKKGLHFAEHPSIKDNTKILKSKSYILTNMASLYTNREEYPLALHCLKRVTNVSIEKGYLRTEAMAYFETASILIKINKKNDALGFINNCINLNANSLDLLVSAYKLKSEILILLGRNKEAYSTCKLCSETSQKANSLQLKRQALECLSVAANILSLHKEAYDYQHELVKVNSTISQNTNIKKLNTVEQIFAYEQEKAQLEQQNEVNKIRLSEEKSRSRIFRFVALLSILGLGLLGFIYVQNKKYTKTTQLKNEEINTANLALSKANEDLCTANTKLNNFTSVAAHDLKAPLRTISSFAQLLKMRNSKKLETKDLEMLGYVSSSSKQLSNMVDDLLAFSNLDKDLGPTSLINVNELVSSVKDNLMYIIEKENATIEVSGDLSEVDVHSNLVGQLFQNLIANGIKFNKEGRNPVVTIKKETESLNKITYSVTDNGIGIAPEFQDQIFTIFKRLNGEKKYSGSGIGLATCKSIIDHYNQKIWVESQEGIGTSFFFSLPKEL